MPAVGAKGERPIASTDANRPIAHRAGMVKVISWVRWVGVLFALVDTLTLHPPPLSRAAGLGTVAALALCNIPATLVDRMPPRRVNAIATTGIVCDFIVVWTWWVITANGPLQSQLLTGCLVGVEAATLFRWRGTLVLMGAAIATWWIPDYVRHHVYHQPVHWGAYANYLVEALMLTGAVTGLASTSDRRRVAAESAGADSQRAHTEAELLYAVSSRLNGNFDVQDIACAAIDTLAEHDPARWYSLFLIEPDDLESARQAGSYGLPETVGIELPEGALASLSSSGLLDERGSLAFTPAAASTEIRADAVVPVRSGAVMMGLMIIGSHRATRSATPRLSFLDAVAVQVGTALEASGLYQQLERLSLTDSLTSLLNRRAFDRRLDEEIARAQRYGTPLALLMIDVDQFKVYNDLHGHLGGDEVLRRVGSILKVADVLRQTDLAFRFGGEEFAILMPLTSGSDAAGVAERLCSLIAVADFPHGAEQPLGRVTVSIGVSELSGSTLTARDLVEQADRALYTAKGAGRNQAVAHAADDPVDAPTSSGLSVVQECALLITDGIQPQLSPG